MELLYFIFGCLFTQLIIPLLDNLLTLILTKIEAKKIKYSELINEFNIKMQKEEYETTEMHPIGFCINDEKSKEEEDDETE